MNSKVDAPRIKSIGDIMKLDNVKMEADNGKIGVQYEAPWEKDISFTYSIEKETGSGNKREKLLNLHQELLQKDRNHLERVRKVRHFL
mgnify:CR=1 FL=1